jgi:hypothetical protein
VSASCRSRFILASSRVTRVSDFLLCQLEEARFQAALALQEHFFPEPDFLFPLREGCGVFLDGALAVLDAGLRLWLVEVAELSEG